MIKYGQKWGSINLNTSVEFGGDILVIPGHGEGYSCVAFKSFSEHPIGTEHATKGMTSDDISPEVGLFFTNPESIDVLIEMLLEVKGYLKKPSAE